MRSTLGRCMLILTIALTVVGCVVYRNANNVPQYGKVIGHYILSPDEEFNPSEIAGKLHCSYAVISSNRGLDALSAKNTVYRITAELNLQGKTLVIPSGCLLYFDGGSFRNGIIQGANTLVVAKDYEVFKHGIRKYRGYSSTSYSYVTRDYDAIVIDGTWGNPVCGSNWTGMQAYGKDECASLAINNFIKLHQSGSEIVFPANQELFVYGRIVCSRYSIDFNHSTLLSADFEKVEDKSIPLPGGVQPSSLKSLYGLVEFNGSNAFIKNLTIDGRAGSRREVPSLGTECLLSMGSNSNCQIQHVTLKDAVGCGICTYAISDCIFDDLIIEGCGEHGVYTHAYKGSLSFYNCRFSNCGQDAQLFKKRGQSACVKFSGSRDFGYASLKDFKAFFTECVFERDAAFPVATTYADISYAEFNRCSWKGVQGYSIVTPQLAEQMGHLVEFVFVDCDNPCSRIQSVNTIRRLIRCHNVTNPFADTIELTDCEINVGYDDVENKYSVMFKSQYDVPVVCSNCVFKKGSEDTPIRNTITNPRPMVFEGCKWAFDPSDADKYRGSYFLVLSNSGNTRRAPGAVTFKNCQIDIDKYRLLYCQETDVTFTDCVYLHSFDSSK